ncbi:MAG: MotA/TolQ/ExbB proton channel family protein, partial [Burkholderiaceae bacterium]
MSVTNTLRLATLAALMAVSGAAMAQAAPEVSKETVANPYGLEAMWAQGDAVAKSTLIIMIIMSIGSWYIIFT